MVRSQTPLSSPQIHERRPLPQRTVAQARASRLSSFLSNCPALFRAAQFPNSFVINSLRTLLKIVFPANSFESVSCALFRNKGGIGGLHLSNRRPWFLCDLSSSPLAPFYASTVRSLQHSQLQFPQSLPHSFPSQRGGESPPRISPSSAPLRYTFSHPIGPRNGPAVHALFMEQILPSRVFTSINAP